VDGTESGRSGFPTVQQRKECDARKKTQRRFDPRPGVSEFMLDTETVYVGQEFRDYEVLSITGLRAMLKDRQTKIEQSGAVLEQALATMPDRERLIVRCLLSRDFYHVAALYERIVRKDEVAHATGPVEPKPEELTADDEPKPVVPFQEWLFT
jgi:hypothetical protein